MYVVSRREDVLLHLGVPLSRLMSEMDARFQKLFHCDNCHNSFPPFYLPDLRYSRNDIRIEKFYGHGMRVNSGVNFQPYYFSISGKPWQAILSGINDFFRIFCFLSLMNSISLKTAVFFQLFHTFK